LQGIINTIFRLIDQTRLSQLHLPHRADKSMREPATFYRLLLPLALVFGICKNIFKTIGNAMRVINQCAESYFYSATGAFYLYIRLLLLVAVMMIMIGMDRCPHPVSVIHYNI